MSRIVRRFLYAVATLPVLLAVFGSLFALAAIIPFTSNAKETPSEKPTIVLVHGAFAGSSSWDAVASRLLHEGYPVIAAANPLRSVKSDASHVGNLIDSIDGPVILVGHSYGGLVISSAALGRSNVRALVYVAAFAPEAGESAFALSAKYPGSTLGEALAPPVALSDGNYDLYIQRARFTDQFAADVSASEARMMAATQRPVTEAALNEGASAPGWKSIPSWFLYGTADRNIPAAALAFMAARAKSRKTVAIDDASHVVMISHPDALVKLIGEVSASVCG